MSKENFNKLIVLGLDGGTFDVLDPLIEKGIMPNLEHIIENGVSSTMMSTFPPLTGPAWVSMATGKNPGKTGITDFINIVQGPTDKKFVSSEDYRVNGAFWDILNDHGYKTYLIGYPMLYPYYEINGVIVSGWGVSDDGKLAYPPEIENRIEEISEGYINHVPWRTKKEYRDDKKILIDDLSTMIKKQKKVVKDLINDEWDLFMYVCSASDFIQHALWDEIKDKDSLNHERVLDLWSEIDDIIGILMDKEENIFLVSDHGFGPLKNKFLPSKWLKENGYLVTGKKNNCVELASTIPSNIDLDNSAAFSHSTGIHGEIHVCIDEGKRKIIKKIKKEMKEYSEMKDFKLNIYEKNELYEGCRLDEIADILFNVDDYKCNISSSSLDGEIYEKNYKFKIRSGNHREQGIFCAYGPDIKSNEKLDDVKIYDFAPTLVHFYDIPVPDDMDGHVLEDIFDKDSEIEK